MTHEEAARRLGVSRVRVTQLVSSGQLTKLTPESLDAHKRRKLQKKQDAEAYKKRMREQRAAERQELFDRLDALDRKMNLLLGATVASAALRP